LLGFTTTPLEMTGFVLSVLTVLFNIRQVHWAWLVSILASAIYGMVFYGSKLYGDMALQLVFISVSVWGWRQWLRADPGGAPSLPVTRLDSRGMLLSLTAWLLCFALLWWFLAIFTDTDVPMADGFLTAGSLLGQLLLSRKKIENWHVWIIVDVLYVALYLHKNLVLTAILYAVFVSMAIAGLLSWEKSAPDAPDAMVLK
jgi:nicotinamide mononucleotide transporter